MTRARRRGEALRDGNFVCVLLNSWNSRKCSVPIKLLIYSIHTVAAIIYKLTVASRFYKSSDRLKTSQTGAFQVKFRLNISSCSNMLSLKWPITLFVRFCFAQRHRTTPEIFHIVPPWRLSFRPKSGRLLFGRLDGIGRRCQPKQWNYILRSSWYSESTRPSVLSQGREVLGSRAGDETHRRRCVCTASSWPAVMDFLHCCRRPKRFNLAFNEGISCVHLVI